MFLSNPTQDSAWCDQQRAAGKQLGYVPTMGALHEGHLALVRRATEDNAASFVSIFVNPLQFNNPDDLAAYPRDMQSDLAMLESAGVDMVYTGTLQDFFPDVEDPASITVEDPCAAIAGLEADHRPGHLQGVQAIVERLFSTAGKCRAYFGEKDFQQTLVVRELAYRRGDIDVVVCPTIREASGLAMSSRNQRLSKQGRQVATTLYEALNAADQAWRRDLRDPATLEVLMRQTLDQPGIQIEYAAVRDPDRWSADTPDHLHAAQALVAAVVEDVRLIDNLRLGN